MNRAEMRKIIKQIAKQNNVSAAEVEREMKAAINSAYENPNAAAMAIPREGAVPTLQEFLGHVSSKIEIDQKDVK